LKAAAFAYARPRSLEEALELMARHGEEARPLAGGQSLVPLLAMRLARPAIVVDLNHLPELAGVEVAAGSRLGGIVDARSITTNSFHHQAVDRLGAGLCTVATSPDGVIEAVECTDRAWWMVGVQWHPEELTATAEEWDRRLFRAFANAVRGAD